MAYPDIMKFELNKDKRIGEVLFIVEGIKTEPSLIYRVFTNIFGYQMERLYRDGKYKVFKKVTDPFSRVIVINTKSSNICSIDKDDQYLNNMFDLLNEDYHLDIDNAAVYYLFDRDPGSNTDQIFIENALQKLASARETNIDWGRQGMLLLSYPCIESFVAMNLVDNSIEYCWNRQVIFGNALKNALHNEKLLPNHINEDTLLHCANELLRGLDIAGVDTDADTLLNSFDDFSINNKTVYDWQEAQFSQKGQYGLLSLLGIALLDLGMIRIIPE